MVQIKYYISKIIQSITLFKILNEVIIYIHRAGPGVNPARLWTWATHHPWGNHRKKNKKFLPQFLSVLFSLADGRQYREENVERNRGKTSKKKRG